MAFQPQTAKHTTDVDLLFSFFAFYFFFHPWVPDSFQDQMESKLKFTEQLGWKHPCRGAFDTIKDMKLSPPYAQHPLGARYLHCEG